MGKALFPMCASFGPAFLALAHLFPHRDGFPYGLLMALPGAAMLSIALNTLYRELVARERPADHTAG